VYEAIQREHGRAGQTGGAVVEGQPTTT